MNHDTNTADLADIAALVDEQRHRLETWPELVGSLTTMIRVAVLSGVEPQWQPVLDEARDSSRPRQKPARSRWSQPPMRRRSTGAASKTCTNERGERARWRECATCPRCPGQACGKHAPMKRS